jgi:hypothetical protein
MAPTGPSARALRAESEAAVDTHVYIAHAILTSPRYVQPCLVCSMITPCQDIEKWVPCTAHSTTQQSLSAMDLIRLLQERTTIKVHGGGM